MLLHIARRTYFKTAYSCVVRWLAYNIAWTLTSLGFGSGIFQLAKQRRRELPMLSAESSGHSTRSCVCSLDTGNTLQTPSAVFPLTFFDLHRPPKANTKLVYRFTMTSRTN
ncbi:hypothetical protein K474DRAFT_1294709 [Panus rudis PR-1116 ss-1]|nr:hypothetical protein K474DRAFT_1294709 [Panus rudis PR-1116 ss-1]